MELEFSDLGKSREKAGNEVRFSGRDRRLRSDESKLTVMAEESVGQSKEGNKMAHAGTWEESNMGLVDGGLIGA